MNEELKKEARKNITAIFEEIEPSMGEQTLRYIEIWMDKATLAERKRCAEIVKNKRSNNSAYHAYSDVNRVCEAITTALEEDNH